MNPDQVLSDESTLEIVIRACPAKKALTGIDLKAAGVAVRDATIAAMKAAGWVAKNEFSERDIVSAAVNARAAERAELFAKMREWSNDLCERGFSNDWRLIEKLISHLEKASPPADEAKCPAQSRSLPGQCDQPLGHTGLHSNGGDGFHDPDVPVLESEPIADPTDPANWTGTTPPIPVQPHPAKSEPDPAQCGAVSNSTVMGPCIHPKGHARTHQGQGLIGWEDECPNMLAGEPAGSASCIHCNGHVGEHETRRGMKWTDEHSCRACGKTLLPDSANVADGCPCNSRRGINHGLVSIDTCTCPECDPEQTGSVRRPTPAPPKPEPVSEDEIGTLKAVAKKGAAAFGGLSAQSTAPLEAALRAVAEHVRGEMRVEHEKQLALSEKPNIEALMNAFEQGRAEVMRSVLSDAALNAQDDAMSDCQWGSREERLEQDLEFERLKKENREGDLRRAFEENDTLRARVAELEAFGFGVANALRDFMRRR